MLYDLSKSVVGYVYIVCRLALAGGMCARLTLSAAVPSPMEYILMTDASSPEGRKEGRKEGSVGST